MPRRPTEAVYTFVPPLLLRGNDGCGADADGMHTRQKAGIECDELPTLRADEQTIARSHLVDVREACEIVHGEVRRRRGDRNENSHPLRVVHSRRMHLRAGSMKSQCAMTRRAVSGQYGTCDAVCSILKTSTLG